MKKYFTNSILVVAILLANTASANVFYIVPGGAGEKTGTDWDNAADLSQAALDLSNPGDEFWVKKGTYQFVGEDYLEIGDVSLYGGFNGNEAARDQRDWANNQTIVTGDAAQKGSLFQHKTPEQMDEPTAERCIDGFIIQDCMYTAGNGNGGAVTLAVKGRLRNCIIRNNITGSTDQNRVGGGVFVNGPNHALEKSIEYYPVIENCLIYNNQVNNNGGGIQVLAQKRAYIVNTTVANNKIMKLDGTQGSGTGCGVGLAPNSACFAANCIVYNNGKPTSDGAGTVIYSFGPNANAAYAKLELLNCAIDAVSTGSGAPGIVTKTGCIDLSASETPGFKTPTTFYGAVASDASEYAEFATADYRLQSTSLCIDAGDNYSVSSSKDLAHTARIFNSIVDMGAYEYDVPSNALNVQKAAKNVAGYSYCDLMGRPVPAATAKGLLLKKTSYTDGSVKVDKVFSDEKKSYKLRESRVE
jgi:hypothetical protein